VGSELLLRQDCLEPQLGAGATLCWIVTLSIAKRGEYEDTFEDPQIVGKWLVGGSHIVFSLTLGCPRLQARSSHFSAQTSSAAPAIA
jgi:hypothetical protein